MNKKLKGKSKLTEKVTNKSPDYPTDTSNVHTKAEPTWANILTEQPACDSSNLIELMDEKSRDSKSCIYLKYVLTEFVKLKLKGNRLIESHILFYDEPLLYLFDGIEDAENLKNPQVINYSEIVEVLTLQTSKKKIINDNDEFLNINNRKRKVLFK